MKLFVTTLFVSSLFLSPPARADSAAQKPSADAPQALPTPQAPPPNAENGLQAPPPRIPGYSFAAAILGYVCAPIAGGAIIAADILKGTHPTVSTGLNAGASVLMTALVPVVAAGSVSVRGTKKNPTHPAITGIKALRGFGWLFYSLVVGAAGPLALLPVFHVHMPDGLVTAQGILAMQAFAFMATDSLVAYYQARSVLGVAVADNPGADSGSGEVRVLPIIGAAALPDGRTTTTLGLGGMF